MSSWLQRLVVSVDLSDNSFETLRYATFLADTYEASLDVVNVTGCPRTAVEDDAPKCLHGLEVTDAAASEPCRAHDGVLSTEERRERILAMLAELPGEAARSARIQIGDVFSLGVALKRTQYDLAILNDRCGRRCVVCQACPVLEALRDCPTCGMMRVERAVQVPFADDGAAEESEGVETAPVPSSCTCERTPEPSGD